MRKVSIESDESSWQFDYNGTSSEAADEFRNMVADSLYNLQTDWMYTAIIQIALKESQPEWSRDDWSFVPVSFSSGRYAPAKQNRSIPGNNNHSKNLTVQTSVIRAHLHCSAVDWTSNVASWLTAQNQNSRSNNLTGLDNYYMPEAICSGW